MRTMLHAVLIFLLLVGAVRGQECPLGMYGDNCKLKCSPFCAPYEGQKVYCDKQTGKCSEGCLPGKYGDRCHLPCSRNCRKNVCSFGTGHCVQGCVGNNTGHFCETSQERGPQKSGRESQGPASTPLVQILAPVMVVSILVTIIVIAVLIVCMRRRKYQRKRPGDLEWEQKLNPGGEDTDLIVACKEGKLQRVRSILKQSVENIDKKGKGGMTGVMWAARRGQREMVDLLVRTGADVELVDDIDNNILHWACYGGHVAMVKHIASKDKVDTNSRGRDGRTPLMCAARHGNKRMFQLLVSKGGLPSEVDTEGNNILLLACWGGNMEIVDYIIQHNAVDINGRGQSGRTPLMAAAYKGHGEIFDLLVEKGADLVVVDDAGDNILHVACLGEHANIVSRVLRLKKVNINSRGHCSRTPLMTAARSGEKVIFDLLVNERADTTPVDDAGNTILHLGSEGGNVDIVEYVLSLENVDINARNKHSETAAMLATDGSDVCNLLVSRGGLTQ